MLWLSAGSPFMITLTYHYSRRNITKHNADLYSISNFILEMHGFDINTPRIDSWFGDLYRE